MSTLRLPGLLTGIDTNTLIAQLMAVERRTLNMYQQRKSLWEEKQNALSTLETKLSTLKSSVGALSDANELRAFTTVSSDSDKLTADAAYNAFEGNHTVVINQLATAERWVHTNGLEYVEDYVGQGTFIYSYNHKETSITTTSTTTLEDLVGLINNDANNPGVTASLLYYNNAYHLVLNGNEAGTDYKIFINASSTKVWQAKSELTDGGDNATLSTKIVDLDQFSGTLAGGEHIEITGTDHNGAPIAQPIGHVDLNVTQYTTVGHLISKINDAFDGIAKATFENGKIILTDNTSGSSNLLIDLDWDDNGSGASLTLPIWTEGGSTTASLENFAPGTFTQTQAAQDAKIKVDGFPSTSAVAEEQTLTFSQEATAGTFTLTYEGQTTGTIAYNATTAQIQAALEALPNVSTGDIAVSGDDLTKAGGGTMTFTFRDTAGDVNMLVINSTGLTPPTPANYVVAEQTKGQDGWISRSSNTIDDVIQGMTLHLHDTTDANGEQITLTRDIASVKEKLNSMINAYNVAVVYIKEKTGYNDVLKTAGLLMGDYVVSTIRSQLITPLIAQTSGFIADIDTFLMPGQIGLELDRDGVLSLNTSVFDAAIASDYMGVLAIIGADKTGSSNSNTIKFYGASSDYTTAGNYDVQVVVSGGAITSAKIKLSTESTYRDAAFSGNIVTGNGSFDDNGYPVYPENGLQLSVDLSQNGTFTATVRVKQGFAGAMEDALDKMLKVTTGSIQIDQEHVDDQTKHLQDRIDDEEDRLTKTEARLVARFARLEKTLALIHHQLAALGFGVTQ
ncbi:MAG TPA: flagellar filament capping protein FliD [Sedimentisphaerales bacterium]|nr:flagellar filament capping protein FliD [Sedimentisphaerales bacterium]